MLLLVAMADATTSFCAAAPAEATGSLTDALPDVDAGVVGGKEARRAAAAADACCRAAAQPLCTTLISSQPSLLIGAPLAMMAMWHEVLMWS